MNIIDLIFEDIFNIIAFLALLIFFVVARYAIRQDILESSLQHKKNTDKPLAKLRYIISASILGILIFSLYIVAIVFSLSFINNILIFIFSLTALHLCVLYIHKKILFFYGQEVEVSGQKYFRKGYEANLYSLLVNGIGIIIGVFLFIKIFEIDSLIQIGGLWAGILAFMGFTAPVWALDMIAGIILLQSKNYLIGNVYYIYEQEIHVWIKNISLTEVKCIDLRAGNPIIYRPSKFRNLTVQNISQGIQGKNTHIIRYIDICIDYTTPINNLRQVCFDAYESMLASISPHREGDYFGENGEVSLEVVAFEDYAVRYRLFYTITSAFYLYKAERLFHEHLLMQQQKAQLYFSTPDLIHLQKT